MIWLNPLRRAIGMSSSPRKTSAASRSRSNRRGMRLVFELLEDRVVPANYVVMTNSDAVVHNGLSLRDALTKANVDSANGESGTITFDPSLQGRMIVLAQGPLELKGTASITIDDQDTNITISGGNVSNLFIVDATTTASLISFTLINGRVISGDTDVIAGGIQNSGTLTIDDCVIDGNSAITLGNTNKAFGGGIYNTGTLTITNSTIKNNVANAGGQVFGAGIYNTGTLHLTNTHVENNSSTVAATQTGGLFASQGTGIYTTGPLTIDGGSTVNNNSASGTGSPLVGGGIFSTSTLIIDASTIMGNSALSGGGGIYDVGGTVTITNSSILSNTGGGIRAAGALTITDSHIDNNNINNFSGAAGVTSLGELSITGGTVSGNINTSTSAATPPALIAAGGVFGNVGVVLDGVTVAGNVASTSGTAINAGAGVYAVGALTLTDTTVSGNSGTSSGTVAMTGVGVFARAGLIMDSSTITGNTGASGTAAIQGVGLFINASALITESTISNNKSNATGGATITGIGVYNRGVATIYESTISRNVMAAGNGALGGGLFNANVMTLSESTVYGNTAAQGGGAANGAPVDATMTISDCTFVANTATTRGGGLYNQGQMVLRGTIMSHEAAPEGPDVAVNLNVLSKLLGEHDLIEHFEGLEETEIADGVNENIVGHDPKIYNVLANYGGKTETIPLLVGSPAIGNGGASHLSAAIGAAETVIPVENTAVFMSNFVSRVIQIDDEEMLITGFDATTLTVQRGYNGTTAADHVKFSHIFPTTDQLGLNRVVNNTTVIGASTFIKDVTPPVVTITSTPPAITNSTSATFTFEATDDFTPTNQLVFKVSVDGGAFVITTSPHTITGLTAGTHTFQVQAIDLQGNIGLSTPVFQWIVDLEAPTVSFTQTPPSITNNTTAVFAFTGTDNITAADQLVFMASLDGAAFTIVTSPQTLTALTEGQHTYEIHSVDQAGNSSTILQYQWTVDLTKPTVSITQMPPAATKSTTALFEFTGTDNFTSTANLVFLVSLDGSEFTIATSPVSYVDLTSADHTFSVQAVDEAGNISDTASYTWTVDAIPPTVEITQSPAPQTMSTSATFAFTGNDNRTLPANLVFEVSLDGSSFTTATSPVNYTNLGTGPHTFIVQSIDEVGNVSIPVSYSWIIDLTPPVASITQMPANPTNQTTATFAFTGTDNVTATDELVFQVSLDGAAFTVATSPTSFDSLADGSHTFQVQAIDLAGNISSVVSYTWVIDTVPPTVSITQQPPAFSNQTTASFTFTGTDNLTETANLVYQFSLDGASFAPAANPLALTALAAGSHTLRVQSIDQAGNLSSISSYTWIVDITVPTVSITSTPPALSNSASSTFSFTGTDNVTLPADLVFQFSIDGSTFTTATSPLNLPDLLSGSHTFQVQSIDQAGNVSTPASFTWTVDTIVPTVSFSSTPPISTQSLAGTFTFTGADNLTPTNQLVFQGSLDGSDFGVVTSPVTFDDLPIGKHTFILQSVDLAGNVSAQVSYSWNVDDTAPVASITQNPPATSFVTTATFAFTGTDDVTPPAQLQFKVSLDGSAFVTATSPISYNDLVLGSHTFRVQAIDQAGNVGTPVAYTWTVATPPPASQVQFSASGYGIVRTQSTINLVVTRTGSVAETVTVDFATSDGTAIAGTDYQAKTGTITFPVGALTQIIPLTILNAGAAGADGKTFKVTLTNATNGGTLPSLFKASVTINDPLAQNAIPGNLTSIAAAFTFSPEARANFVQQSYIAYLRRPAEQNGLDYWSGQLIAGLTDQQLEAKFIGSSEYIASHGGNGPGWVTGMYQDLLGRSPDANGLNFWVGQLNLGVSPESIALGFAASAEREGNWLGAAYQIYLGRVIDDAGKASWLQAFAGGTQNEEIVAALVGSAEYYNNLAKGQENRAQWVQRAIDDILHREASDGDVAYWTSVMN